ncbi:hypothetical protein CEXT_782201 [Caerostris extrusa]|uniref:Uncharacterized protein n=1 Tax=Caerostris extrusa TaxID=172846 RepID=A0AAV4Y9V7_CAEEX|nr:hypothetical protein CEXT_782201 [Caerostris extrusa]
MAKNIMSKLLLRTFYTKFPEQINLLASFAALNRFFSSKSNRDTKTPRTLITGSLGQLGTGLAKKLSTPTRYDHTDTASILGFELFKNIPYTASTAVLNELNSDTLPVLIDIEFNRSPHTAPQHFKTTWHDYKFHLQNTNLNTLDIDTKEKGGHGHSKFHHRDDNRVQQSFYTKPFTF